MDCNKKMPKNNRLEAFSLNIYIKVRNRSIITYKVKYKYKI